jgi:Hint domain
MSDITKLFYFGNATSIIGALDEITVTNGTTDSSEVTFAAPSNLSLEGLALVPQDGIYFVSAFNNTTSITSTYEEHAGQTPSYTSALATVSGFTGDFSVDTVNSALYFIDNSSLYTERFGAGFSGTPTTVDLGSLGSISTTSVGPTNALVYDQAHNAVYYAGESGGAGFTTSSGGTSGGGVQGNYIYKVTGLTGSSFTGNTQVAHLPLNDGTPISMALDTATDTLYFVTRPSVGDADSTLGLYGISLSGSATPFAVYTQTSSTGAFGAAWNLLDGLTIDSQTGEYYINAIVGGTTSQEEIFAGNVNGIGTAPTLFLPASTTAPRVLAIDGGPVLSGTSVHAIDGNTGSITGALTTADTVTLAVTLNGNVTVSGTPTLSLNDGGTATYASGSGGNVLLFTYTPTSGQNAATLAVTGMTGTVTDAFGAGFDDTIAASFAGLSVDGTPPTLTLSSTSSDALQGGSSIAALSGAPTITDSAGTGTLTGATIALANAQAGDVLGINGSTSGTLDGISFNSSGTVLTLSGSAALANYEAVLGDVTYKDGGTDSSTTGHPVRTLDWTVKEGGLVSTTQTSSITIERALTVSAGGTVTALVGGSGVVLDSGIAITDLDAAPITGATVSITSGLTSGDVLNFTAQNGISASYNAGTGVLTLSGSASAANYQTALASIRFSDSSAGGGTRGISYVLSNAAGASNTGVSNVVVDTGPSFVSASVLGIDGNAGQTTGVVGVGDSVTINVTLSEAGTVTGTPVLSLNDGGTASYVAGSGTNVLTFSYAPSSGQDVATLAVTGLSGTVKDAAGAGLSNGVTASFAGLAVDTTPPDLSVTSTSGGALEGGAPVVLLNSAPTITDADGTGTLTGASVVIANAQTGDVLAINGATSGSLDSGAISYSFSGDTLSLSGSDSTAAYETALSEITYQDGGTDTVTSGFPVRNVDWSVSEGTLISAVQTSSISIERELVVNAGGTVTLTSGGSVALDSGITITDLDDTTISSATVAITSGFESGDELNFTDQNGITGSYDAATGVLDLTGSGSAADYQAALASVSISSLNADPSDGGADPSRAISYTLGELSTPGSSAVVAVCYLRGTSILTAKGEQPVEQLAIGDMVATRRGGLQRIKWIGRQSFDPRFVRNNREKLPVCIKAGALGGGLPLRDLSVSPGHSMLLGEHLILARNLVNGVTITQTETAEDVHYYNIELETHDCVLAEGSWAESYADAPGLRAQFHNAARFWALYPDYVEPRAVSLCLPRPECGPELAAALAPVVAQATLGVAPGPLLGWVDRVAYGFVQGWAVDTAQPELPVLLEVLCGAEVLGTILACDPRPDLRAAGHGQGHSSFTFPVPQGLVQADITVRRAGGSAPLPFANATQKSQIAA